MWESQAPEEVAEPTTPSTAHFEPVEERDQSAAADSDEDTISEESLQKLKDWQESLRSDVN
jgi:hypothetical protein